MKGSLVKWIHDDKPTNICVILRGFLHDVDNDEASALENEESPLFLVYDFVTDEIFYAVLEELQFI
tara:strand:+ start:469 stop:666 length:198 start_codon:yes stop_codon:yes gene_type:complete